MDSDRAIVRIDDEHQADPEGQILPDLLIHVDVPVLRREDLDDELGRDIEKAARFGSAFILRVRDEDDIGPPDAIRIPLRFLDGS
jgi:hypothetical protein